MCNSTNQPLLGRLALLTGEYLRFFGILGI